VAGGVALLVAGFEQAAQFHFRQLARTKKAAAWWAVRLLTEMGMAVLVLGVADEMGWRPADKWWGGLIVVGATTAGLRSTFLDLPDKAVGIAPIFSRARTFVARHLQNIEAVDTAAHVNDHVVPTITRSPLTIQEVGQRLETFIHVSANLSDSKESDELAFVRDTVQDVADDEEQRVAALVNKALELGGDALIDDLVKAAQDRGG
jgi:hypothetical protein